MNTTTLTNHTATISNLRAAIDALAAGDADKAASLLARASKSSAPPPPVVETLALGHISPEYASAEASVHAAGELYSETIRQREAVLRAIRETHGTGPFLDVHGRRVVLVARTRGEGGKEQLFIRHVG